MIKKRYLLPYRLTRAALSRDLTRGVSESTGAGAPDLDGDEARTTGLLPIWMEPRQGRPGLLPI